MEATGLGRSSIYKFIALGTFPKPVQLGDRAVGWVDHEVDDWIAERVADRDKAASQAERLDGVSNGN